MQTVSRARLALYVALGALGATALFGLLYWLQGNAALKGAFNDLIQAASAVGTVGAVWFAVHASRRERAEEASRLRDAAFLRAAGLEPVLYDALQRLRKALNDYHMDALQVAVGASLQTSRFQTSVTHLDAILRASGAEVFFQTPEDLFSFSILPDHCAHRLYTSGTHLRQMLKEFEEHFSAFGYSDTPEFHKRSARWVEMAEEAARDLGVAQRILESVRKQAAPKSHNSLHFLSRNRNDA